MHFKDTLKERTLFNSKKQIITIVQIIIMIAIADLHSASSGPGRVLGTQCIFIHLILTREDYFYPQGTDGRMTQGILGRMPLKGSDGGKGLLRLFQILSGWETAYSDW